MTLMLTKIMSYVIYYHDYMCVELTVHGVMHDHDNTTTRKNQPWTGFDTVYQADLDQILECIFFYHI